MVRVLKTHLHYQMRIVINLDLYPIFIVNSPTFTSMNFINRSYNTFFIMIIATIVIIFIQVMQPLKSSPLL